MEISKKVKFNDISEIYLFDADEHLEIETKKFDGPNLYRSFFEQFIISYIFQKENIKNLIKKYIKIIQSTKFIIINDIKNIIYNLIHKKQHNFYIMNFTIKYSQDVIKQIYFLYNLLSQSDFNSYL